jgi:hypothetical protein
MEKAAKKSPKEASNLFHNIMKASVSGNPKPKNNEDADKAKNAFDESTGGIWEKSLDEEEKETRDKK